MFPEWQTNLVHQLEELHIVRSSLLPGERFTFILPPDDLATWSTLLDAFADVGGSDTTIASLPHPPCQARFQMHVSMHNHEQIAFEVELPPCMDATDSESAAGGFTTRTNFRGLPSVSVKSDRFSRDVQERWRAEIRDRSAEIDETCAFPTYELLTLLTATLHEQSCTPPPTTVPTPAAPSAPIPPAPHSEPYHALLTSHHLISPTKRRTLQHLSSQLSITGFAKVGYPGVIYAEGTREAVEAFVRDVKGWQWLALRVRFVVPVPNSSTGVDGSGARCRERWVEVSKIGEVLEQMRMRGREALVTDLGIGVPSKELKH